MKFFAAAFSFALGACGGSRQDTSLSSDMPDNHAIKSVCYALSQDLDAPVAVSADDAAPVRLCAVVQKDGHVGLDLRYQAQEKMAPYPIFATVTLDDGEGRTASDIFRMKANPFSGSYELYLTDGCLIGAFGGCSQHAQKKMRTLFDVLNDRERAGKFDVSLAFAAMKSDKEAQWDLHNPLKKQNYTFAFKNL